MTVDGTLIKRRDLTTVSVTLKKAEKTIILGVDMQKTGKIDLTLRPATLKVALKTLTKNLAKNIDADVVMDIKKNAGLIKAQLAASINKVEQFKTAIEITRTSAVTTAAAETFIMPLGVNTGATVRLTTTDATDFEIVMIGNKANAKDTTLTFTGTLGMTATSWSLLSRLFSQPAPWFLTSVMFAPAEPSTKLSAFHGKLERKPDTPSLYQTDPSEELSFTL